VLEEIEEITNPKVKAGKKALLQEQVQLKQSLLAVLDAVRDESSKDAPVRLVFEPKSRTVEQAELITTLLAHTSLESSVPLNLTMVGLDGRPVGKGLRRILVEWIEFRLHRGPAHAPPAAKGAGPHARAGRPAAGAAEHRRGDPHHPQRRRAQAGADGALCTERPPGRGHPGDPPAPAGAAGGHQDRAGAEGTAHRTGQAGRHPGQPGGAASAR
jgi:hypothetical protein